MANRINEKKISERLERIEKTLIELSGLVGNLTEAIESFLEIPEADYPINPELPGNSRFYEDLDIDQYEKPPSPWALKSIERAELDWRIGILKDIESFGILKDIESLLPTLKALKSNPDGLTAEEVSRITMRGTNIEDSYLSNMFILGIVDSFRFGENKKYRLGTEKWIPENIRNQL